MKRFLKKPCERIPNLTEKEKSKKNENMTVNAIKIVQRVKSKSQLSI